MRQSFDWRDIPCAKVSSKALHSLYAGSVPAVADVVHRKNVRMAQRAHSACLLLESKKTVRVGRERLRKDFYRHFPPEPCIARDAPHPCLRHPGRLQIEERVRENYRSIVAD